MMAGQGFGLVLQAAYFILLARLLSSTEYGIFAGAFAFTSIASQFSSVGMGSIFIRYVSLDHKAFSVYWGNILLAIAGTSGLLVLILPFAGQHLLNPSSAKLVLLSTIANCICGQLTVEISRIFLTFEKMRITATLNLLTQLMRTLAVLLMIVVLHHSTAWWWAVVSMLVSIVASAIAICTVIRCFGWPRFSPLLFARRGIEGISFAFSASTTPVLNDIDKTMLSSYGMNLENGIYSLAYRVIDMATIPIYAIRDAVLPRMFRNGPAGIVATYELTLRLMKRCLLLGTAAAAGVFVLSPLVPHVLGHGFYESAAALRWLCLIPIFRGVHQLAGSALAGSGFQRYRTLAQVLAGGFNFGVNLWLIPQYGWRGAAWSSLATDGGLAAFNLGVLMLLTWRSECRLDHQAT
jgi:O-antigen/teichoic acid export membrane protein